MRYNYFLPINFFSFSYSGLSGQEKNNSLITGDFKELKIEGFIRELESQTGFHFYYDPNQFDNLQLNFSIKDQPLQKVLELAFNNTGFHFSIDQHNNVFLTRDKI